MNQIVNQIKLWVEQGKSSEAYAKMDMILYDNDIVISIMYSNYKEGKSIVTETFIRTLKGKIYKITTANDSKSYLDYLNKLIDN